MTGALVTREVWLPSKAYKYNSIWWHQYVGPINDVVKHLVTSDSPLEIANSFFKGYRPCKFIDLKGCGLQYPREYILIIMEVINKLYPSAEGEEHMNIAKSLFDNILIEEDDGEMYHPLRGVGLGYYTNLMVLASAIMLSDCEIFKMFSDDILIFEEDYQKGIDSFLSYNMILNYKKCGELWYKSPMFAGCQFYTDDQNISTLLLENAELSAIFTKRYHHERKSIARSLNKNTIMYFCYHYEKLFGYEFFKGESVLHPQNLGINTLAFPIKGWRDDYFISKMNNVKKKDESNEFIYPHPSNPTRKEMKLLHFKRKEAYKHRTFCDVTYEEYLHPQIEERGRGLRNKLDSIARSTPIWSEFNQMVYKHTEVGKYSLNIDKSKVNKALGLFPFSDNPMACYQRGGYDIITPYYYPMPAEDAKQQLAELVLVCKKENQKWAEASFDRSTEFYRLDWATEIGDEKPIEVNQILEMQEGDDIPHDTDDVSVDEEEDPFGALDIYTLQELNATEGDPDLFDLDPYGVLDEIYLD
jgi:hypothetical protein